jgi:hypothetical protein
MRGVITTSRLMSGWRSRGVLVRAPANTALVMYCALDPGRTSLGKVRYATKRPPTSRAAPSPHRACHAELGSPGRQNAANSPVRGAASPEDRRPTFAQGHRRRLIRTLKPLEGSRSGRRQLRAGADQRAQGGPMTVIEGVAPRRGSPGSKPDQDSVTASTRSGTASLFAPCAMKEENDEQHRSQRGYRPCGCIAPLSWPLSAGTQTNPQTTTARRWPQTWLRRLCSARADYAGDRFVSQRRLTR